MTNSQMLAENINRLMKHFGEISEDDEKALAYLDKQEKNKEMIENLNKKVKADRDTQVLVTGGNASALSYNTIATSSVTSGWTNGGVILGKQQQSDFKELMKLIHVHMVCLKNGIRMNEDDTSFTRNNEMRFSGLSDKGYKKMEELYNKLKDDFQE